eukprot:Rhum_TRINITY_DN14000_c3_g1::Rhum_TRINITY_DN14000_c3_g1_i1::g.67343::m.67343
MLILPLTCWEETGRVGRWGCAFVARCSASCPTSALRSSCPPLELCRHIVSLGNGEFGARARVLVCRQERRRSRRVVRCGGAERRRRVVVTGLRVCRGAGEVGGWPGSSVERRCRRLLLRLWLATQLHPLSVDVISQSLQLLVTLRVKVRRVSRRLRPLQRCGWCRRGHVLRRVVRHVLLGRRPRGRGGVGSVEVARGVEDPALKRHGRRRQLVGCGELRRVRRGCLHGLRRRGDRRGVERGVGAGRGECGPDRHRLMLQLRLRLLLLSCGRRANLQLLLWRLARVFALAVVLAADDGNLRDVAARAVNVLLVRELRLAVGEAVAGGEGREQRERDVLLALRVACAHSVVHLQAPLRVHETGVRRVPVPGRRGALERAVVVVQHNRLDCAGVDLQLDVVSAHAVADLRDDVVLHRVVERALPVGAVLDRLVLRVVHALHAERPTHNHVVRVEHVGHCVVRHPLLAARRREPVLRRPVAFVIAAGGAFVVLASGDNLPPRRVPPLRPPASFAELAHRARLHHFPDDLALPAVWASADA